MPMVILESTGHYHTPVIQFLEEQGVLYILLNPIISYQAKKTSLRKVKTDAIDAYQLSVLYYKEDLEPHKIRGINIVESRSISFRLIEQKEVATNLVIVLPGAGYTTQAPLLHFTTGVFYTKGFDVLHINYIYSKQELDDLSEEEFSKDVQLTIDIAIKNKKYSHYYVVAKSMGTIALSYLLNHTMLKDAKVVWLTPLLQREDVFNAMVNSDNKGLCIIGDKDRYFIVERFEKLKNNHNLILKVVDGGNHSLELDEDPIKSIEILKNVVSDINEF